MSYLNSNYKEDEYRVYRSVYLDSGNRSGGTNNRPSFNLDPEIHSSYKLKLLSSNIPLSFYTFNNNVFEIQEIASGFTASSWLASSSPNDYPWKSVCWSPNLGIFCAVASGKAMTSKDGLTWSVVNAPSNNWTSICWAPQLNLFVAVADSGTGNRVMTSSNGTNWTLQASAEDNDWISVCWSPDLNLFCAVATSGTNRIMVSSNGITWTAVNIGIPAIINGICWSPDLGIFCGVGIGVAITSINGLAWSYSIISTEVWYSVCWSPELSLFVAVATNGVIMFSADGIFWTDILIGAVQFSSVTWSSQFEQFVAVGNGICYTSLDGTTWTSNTVLNNSWSSVCWSPELYIFCSVSNLAGLNNNVSMISTLPTTSFTLNGNYNTTNLPSEIASQLNTNSTNGNYTTTYDIITNKLTIGADIDFKLIDSNANKFLGFRQSMNTFDTSITSDSSIMLNKQYLVIRSDELTNSVEVASRSYFNDLSNTNILSVIPIINGANQFEYFELPSAVEYLTSNGKSLANLSFYVEDPDGNEIDFNGIPFQLKIGIVGV